VFTFIYANSLDKASSLPLNCNLHTKGTCPKGYNLHLRSVIQIFSSITAHTVHKEASINQFYWPATPPSSRHDNNLYLIYKWSYLCNEGLFIFLYFKAVCSCGFVDRHTKTQAYGFAQTDFNKPCLKSGLMTILLF